MLMYRTSSLLMSHVRKPDWPQSCVIYTKIFSVAATLQIPSSPYESLHCRPSHELTRLARCYQGGMPLGSSLCLTFTQHKLLLAAQQSQSQATSFMSDTRGGYLPLEGHDPTSPSEEIVNTQYRPGELHLF